MDAINKFFASLPAWNIQSLTGYEPKTTFWQDFSIADAFGPVAVFDLLNQAFNEWKKDIVYLTELVMVINHKSWFHDALREKAKKAGDEKREKLESMYVTLYSKMYYALDKWCGEHLTGEDAEYYYRTLD